MCIYHYKELTGEIIKAGHVVHNYFGYGFLEKVYHNALAVELGKGDRKIEVEKKLLVHYEDQVVGEYFADIVVDNKVIVEVKAVDHYKSFFEAQLLNYLKATSIDVGLIINFGRSVEVKRMVSERLLR